MVVFIPLLSLGKVDNVFCRKWLSFWEGDVCGASMKSQTWVWVWVPPYIFETMSVLQLVGKSLSENHALLA